MKPFDTTLANLPPEARRAAEPSLSRRVAGIVPPMAAEIDTRVGQLAERGKLVIALHRSEPLLSTPDHIVEAAVAACRSRPRQWPSPTTGIPPLREAISAKTSSEWLTEVSADQVVVTGGRRQSLMNALAAVVDVGDEVILPAPYWPTYPVAVELVGGRVVAVPAAVTDGLKVNVQQLQAALTPRTTALLLCSPCDPTGAVYSREEMSLIGEWAVNEGLWVITDETYQELVYGGAETTSLPALAPAIRDRCIILGGVTEAYAMTGWHVGWLVVPPRMARGVAAYQSHAASDVSTVAQAAALAALEGDLAPVRALRAELDGRRRQLMSSLTGLPGVEVVEPQGALYVFPSVEACLGGHLAGTPIRTTLDLADALLEHAGVSVMPGEVFGRLGHVRISFAVSDESLEPGITRLVAGLNEVAASRTSTE